MKQTDDYISREALYNKLYNYFRDKDAPNNITEVRLGAVRSFVKYFPSVNMGELKVIDFERKGNVVRLYLGVGTDYWGDDWDDVPYECNAGTVYDKYVRGYVDVAFPFNMLVREPSDDWTVNSRWSKDDMKKRKVPCIVITDDNDSWDDNFSTAMADESSRKIYFGDTVESLMSCGGAILEASIEKDS